MKEEEEEGEGETTCMRKDLTDCRNFRDEYTSQTVCHAAGNGRQESEEKGRWGEGGETR